MSYEEQCWRPLVQDVALLQPIGWWNTAQTPWDPDQEQAGKKNIWMDESKSLSFSILTLVQSDKMNLWHHQNPTVLPVGDCNILILSESLPFTGTPQVSFLGLASSHNHNLFTWAHMSLWGQRQKAGSITYWMGTDVWTNALPQCNLIVLGLKKWDHSSNLSRGNRVAMWELAGGRVLNWCESDSVRRGEKKERGL